MDKEKEDSFSKGFKFAAGFIVFVLIFLFFFRPRLIIGPVDSEGNIVVPKETTKGLIYSSVPIKEKNSTEYEQKNKIVDTNITISTTKTTYDLSDYPNFLIRENAFDGVLVVGDRGPAEDIISISNIISSLKYSDNKEISVDTPLLASEVTDITNENAILVGSPCVNKIIAELFPNFDSSKCVDYSIYCGIPKDKGIILVVENNGKTQILVTGFSQTTINYASKILANYKYYNLDGNLVIINESGGLEIKN